MNEITLTKRQILKHKGTMTVDVYFADGKNSFTKAFEVPIDATLDEIAVEVKTWLEEKEAGEQIPTNEKIPLDLSNVVTERLEYKEYLEKKRELAEMKELVDLGVIADTDPSIKALQLEVKAKYKPSFTKKK